MATTPFARSTDRLVLRVARLEDVPALTELIVASVRGLQNDEYSTADRGSSRHCVRNRTDDDQRWNVLRSGRRPRGCWLWRLESQIDPAKIRGFFVHPSWARQGLGTRILLACEEAARAAGFRQFELVSTLTGVPLYRNRGYIEVERVTLTLPNSEPYGAVRMKKG